MGEPKPAQAHRGDQDGWVKNQEPKGVWVIKHAENDFTVYNGRCVHLGCAYSWNAGQEAVHVSLPWRGYTIDGQSGGGAAPPPPRYARMEESKGRPDGRLHRFPPGRASEGGNMTHVASPERKPTGAWGWIGGWLDERATIGDSGG